ncbi:hypothetical protein ACFYXM_11420 [Streptomyces sp. NPDC002476]|uniref:hypothetical protein n=1 Tax=Streptomyces sp. NPDC002476 TaxID=3364648 RepID=UPI0036B396DA
MTGEIPQEQVTSRRTAVRREVTYARPDADRLRAQLTAEGISFREETAVRDAREVTEFHIERPEASQ